MRVSVIVPLYNKVTFVQRAINSILTQSYTDFELIVVDDGSTDGSRRVVSENKDSRMKIVCQANAGPGAARNTGLKHAKGELIAFLDADDEWLPNYLSESVKLLDAAHPTTAAIASGYFEYPLGKSTEQLWQRRGIDSEEIRLSPHFSPLRIVHLLAFMSSWSTVAKRVTLERWGGFYSDDHCTYAEDAHLWLKVLLNERIRFNLTPLVNFHREASELSKFANGPRQIEPFLRHPDKIREVCPPALTPLLEQVLAIRALKTACMLGFWGKWQAARQLMQAFETKQVWNVPYYSAALIFSTPLGSILGALCRYIIPRKISAHDLGHSLKAEGKVL